jgi:hypothetical protein
MNRVAIRIVNRSLALGSSRYESAPRDDHLSRAQSRAGENQGLGIGMFDRMHFGCSNNVDAVSSGLSVIRSSALG